MNQELTERRPPNHWSGRIAARGCQSVWWYGSMQVISTLAMMKLPRGDGTGLTWLVSASVERAATREETKRLPNGTFVRRVKDRPSDRDMSRVRRAFGMEEAEEDNHEPGVARKLFLVVDQAGRASCECKEGDTVVVEPNGQTWSSDPECCGGCQMEPLTGKPCTVHGAQSGRDAGITP